MRILRFPTTVLIVIVLIVAAAAWYGRGRSLTVDTITIPIESYSVNLFGATRSDVYLSGVLRELDDACLIIEREDGVFMPIWPHGTRVESAGGLQVFVGRHSFRVGDSISYRPARLREEKQASAAEGGDQKKCGELRRVAIVDLAPATD